MVEISFQLPVIPDNKVLIPGCEPTSNLTSNKLSSWLAQNGCIEGGLLDLDEITNNIEGVYIKFGDNFGVGNMKQKWVVFPPHEVACPCSPYTDWYQELRNLASIKEAQQRPTDDCGPVDMGYCTVDFDDYERPPASPYREEGVFPAGVGVLPPLPPWAVTS